MLIHSYVTDGYYDFAVSMLESFKAQHNDQIPFLIHSKDLSDEQILGLESRYSNLTIRNSDVDWEWLQQASGMGKQKLLVSKQQVEQRGNRFIPKWSYHWKHYISIYSRYRDSIVEAFDFAGEGEHVLHLDIDLYINKPIDTIFNLIELADVSLLLRPGLTPEWRKVYGCIMGFTVNDNSRRFMKQVRSHIDAVNFDKIPRHYGQTIFWRSYCDLQKSGIKFAKIPQNWVDHGFKANAFILSANNGLLKKVTAERYRKMSKKGKA